MEPIILHIELGDYPVASWLKNNRYVIFSELLRYCRKMLELKLTSLQAIMVSNVNDNIVFIIKDENIELILEKALSYFMEKEEYEKCAEIRDLNILIQKNKDNESKNIKNSKSNQRQSKANR
jgi:hypothetical protein